MISCRDDESFAMVPLTSSFSFGVLLFLSSVFNSCSAQNQEYLGCAPRICNGTWIQYPFFPLINSSQSTSNGCGLPGLGLTCHNNNTLLFNTSTGLSFRVLGIDYASYTINLTIDPTLIRNESGCIYPTRNITLNDIFAGNPILPLNLTSLDRTENFFYHCTNNVSGTVGDTNYLNPSTTTYDFSSQYLHSCPNFSYAFFDDYFLSSGVQWNCQNRMNFPVLGTDSTSRRSSEMVALALSQGFAMAWPPNPNCSDCARSGGRCGRNTTGGSFVCFCQEDTHPSNCYHARKARIWLKVTIGISAAACGFIIAIVGSIYARRYCARKKRSPSADSLTRSIYSSKTSSTYDLESKSFHRRCGGRVTVFPYKELEEATNNFSPSNELGDGGFGAVYFGKLHDGRKVAVKRLYENNYKRVEQFMNEIEILSGIVHPNLVCLYGCTSRHSRELLLVYEYINNGTVGDHIHGSRKDEGHLSWKVRLSIALQTAKALAYLHQLDPQIIHRDVKTNNILLNQDFHVKVADFGLSRLFPLDVTHVSTAPQGTPGYVDPDYHKCYQLTDKSDVYSFGVVLAELISSLSAVDIRRHRHEINLANMAINKIHNHELHEFVDSSLGFETDEWVNTTVRAVAELAFRCLAPEREVRPAMDEVVRSLMQITSEGIVSEKTAPSPEMETGVLLKSLSASSPKSVTEKWASHYTTPNNSG